MGSQEEAGKSLLGKREGGSLPEGIDALALEIHESFLHQHLEGNSGSGARVPAIPDNRNNLFGSGGGSSSSGSPSGGGGGGNGDTVTLKDIGGLTEEINFLKRSVLYPLTHKDDLGKWGFIPPKGIMFHGPPGTGKTLLAKAIANELSQQMNSKVKFIYRKGTDCHSKWFGQSSANLREIFKEAQQNKPSLLFFDEIDGLCPSRESSSDTSQVYATVVTTFLGMMDELKPGEVFVIGATNRLDSLDPALRRPGRFDKELRFSSPDENGRKIILGIHTKNWNPKNKPSVELIAEIAAATSGFTGAYLHNLCSQTSTCAIKRFKVKANIETMTSAHLSQVLVAKEDWLEALRQVGRPKTNVFGSVLYAAQAEPKVRPLLSPQVERIKNKMLNITPFEENFNVLKSFLIYGTTSTVPTFVIPELLSHKELQSIPVYQLSLESISKYYYDSVGKIMSQVMTCNKPCILYMPNCDYLFKNLSHLDKQHKSSTVQFLVNKLMLTTTRPVLILGTSCCGPANLPFETNIIFQPYTKPEHAYKMRSPNEEERRMFFRSVLNKKTFGEEMTGQKWDSFFNEKVEACVKITDYDPFEYIFELQSELVLVGNRNVADEKAFMKAIDNAIENYRIIEMIPPP